MNKLAVRIICGLISAIMALTLVAGILLQAFM